MKCMIFQIRTNNWVKVLINITENRMKEIKKLILLKELLYQIIRIILLSVYSPFSDRVRLPLHNIPSPFLSVMDIFFVDLKFCHICFYTF